MRRRKAAAAVFALLAAVIAGAALVSVLWLRDTPVILLKAPEQASAVADTFLRAVCAGDYEFAQTLLYGRPDLGMDKIPENTVSGLVWEAFVDSTDYQLKGECFATESGLAQNAAFCSLELTSVTENMGSRAQLYLEERVAQAENAGEIYDSDNNYREQLVLEVLEQVTRDAIRQDARYVETEIVLKMVFWDGQWWILPEQALLNTLFGGVA